MSSLTPLLMEDSFGGWSFCLSLCMTNPTPKSVPFVSVDGIDLKLIECIVMNYFYSLEGM
jgi:hypothetical protein